MQTTQTALDSAFYSLPVSSGAPDPSFPNNVELLSGTSQGICEQLQQHTDLQQQELKQDPLRSTDIQLSAVSVRGTTPGRSQQ